MALALGRTVGELRAQMTYRELVDWIAYIERNGPVNPMLRTDAAVARLASVLTTNATPKDFMPWPKDREAAVAEATPETVFAMLRAVAKPKPSGAKPDAKVIPMTPRSA